MHAALSGGSPLIEIMLFCGGVWLWPRWAAHLRVEEREAKRARIQGELRLGYPRQ